METKQTQQEVARKLGRIFARAWSDAEFKRRLLTDPAAVAKEYEMPVPDGVEVRVVEDTPRVRHFILPPRPSSDMSDEQLDQVVGGTCLGMTTQLCTTSDGSTTGSGSGSGWITCSMPCVF